MAPFPYTWKPLYLYLIFACKLQLVGNRELLEFTISSFPIRKEQHTKKNPLKTASHVLQGRRIRKLRKKKIRPIFCRGGGGGYGSSGLQDAVHARSVGGRRSFTQLQFLEPFLNTVSQKVQLDLYVYCKDFFGASFSVQEEKRRE